MGAQKYHIGKNGPAPCNAHPERPNGRACRFGDELHGTRAEMEELWEIEQEESNGDHLAGARRADPEIDQRMSATNSLSDQSKYRPRSTAVVYSDTDQSVAMRLALSNISKLSYIGIAGEDTDWRTNGISTVKRFELEDGSYGYFKPFGENSYNEHEFVSYGTNSLQAAVSEVNAHRLAKAFGPGFDRLVPETALREIDGELGSIQREVYEDADSLRSFDEVPELREDYRKAAILDFVMGNLDRHDQNFIFGAEPDHQGGLRDRIRLIDNSFAFPDPDAGLGYNHSLFADNKEVYEDEKTAYYTGSDGYRMPTKELDLRSDELKALANARVEIHGWVESRTIDPDRGDAAIARIDHLLEEERMVSLKKYFQNSGQTDPF